MGVWGVGIYQNDIALDVCDTFKEQYNDGKSSQEITEKLISEYSVLFGDDDEEPLFWFALADTQWKFGVLLPEVKEKALYWIEKDRGVLRFQMIGKPSKTQRARKLDELRDRLNSPQPPVKKVKKKRIYKCQWNIGDVFAYKLESDLAKERGLYGRYFLIQKVDEGTWYPGHIVPIVYVKITKDTSLPSSEEEYNKLEYVQTWFTRYEDRFLPIDMRRPQEDIAEKSKINYQVDEYGILPQYRAKLLSTSKRVIPKKLIYVGNFVNTIRPPKEFIPHSKENVVPVSWKQFDETFETEMIKLYYGYNLREFSIYKNNN